jgi:hypothetical protein
MELYLKRSVKTDTTTIGKLSVNGKFLCLTLEDKDRDLVSTMAAADVAKIKVFAKTAIPRGRYKIILNQSTRFKKEMPLLLDVPGFAGIRIHSGNTSEDTEGCILVGENQQANFIGESRKAFNVLMTLLKGRYGKEEIFITID